MKSIHDLALDSIYFGLELVYLNYLESSNDGEEMKYN